MRHMLVAAGLFLAALIVVYGTATMLEDRATAGKDPDAEPYMPGAPPAAMPAGKPAAPEQSRSLSLVTRHS